MENSKGAKVLSVVSLVVSIFAFVIGFLSWSETRRNRIINEDVNRPLLKADGFKLRGTSWDIKDRIVVQLGFMVKNVGKGTAVVSSLTDAPIEVEIFNESNDCKLIETHDQYRLKDFHLLPDTDFGILVTAIVSRNCEKRPELKLPMIVNLEYANEATGKIYDTQVLTTTAVISPDCNIAR